MAQIQRDRDRIRAGHLDENGDVVPTDQASPIGYHEDPAAVRAAEAAAKASFIVKDSGAREEYDSGMVRDTAEGKPDYTLILDGPMLERYAEHLTKGAKKYSARNWMKAQGDAELERFRQSALRHMLQWLRGDDDEDHAAAVYFNINGAEYVKEQMKNG
jgi:hypothetical protein